MTHLSPRLSLNPFQLPDKPQLNPGVNALIPFGCSRCWRHAVSFFVDAPDQKKRISDFCFWCPSKANQKKYQPPKKRGRKKVPATKKVPAPKSTSPKKVPAPFLTQGTRRCQEGPWLGVPSAWKFWDLQLDVGSPNLRSPKGE